MNKKLKGSLTAAGALGALVVLASCNSFCSVVDTANFRYSYDPINTTFYESKDDAYNDLVNDFSSSTGLSSELFTIDDLVYTNDEGSISYKDDKNAFDEEIFHCYNSNLYSINAGKLSVSVLVNEDDKTKTTYSGYVGLSDFSVTMLTNSTSTSYAYVNPSYSFFDAIDQKTLELVIDTANNDKLYIDSSISSDYSNLTFENIYGYSSKELKQYESLSKGDEKTSLLNQMKEERSNKSLFANYGYLKHYTLVTNEDGNESVDNFKRIEDWNNELVATLGANNVMTTNYLNAYKTLLSNKVGTVQSCITVNDGFYGNLNNDPLNNTVKIEAKASDFWQGWGEAFSKHGFLEGLLVYPIGVGIENLAHVLGMNGYGQIGAVLIMTVIVRLAFMLITLPSTISQQKMTMLQPEIAKLQQKYPNAQTNQYDKQRLGQAQMALYKKNHINPMTQILVLIIQFPLFICVRNAMRGSASLTSDSVLGLNLSDTIWNVLKDFSNWPTNPGWWTALCLILLMSAGQIITILLPKWMNKKGNKGVAKTVKSETANSQQQQMKWMQIFMVGFVIIMGFNLPSAMGVYWFAGSLFSIAQSLIINLVLSKKGDKK